MTPAEINQAIAESMGWVRRPENPPHRGFKWKDPDGEVWCFLPNYHDDLNAIQQAVALMPNSAHNAFQWEVMKYLMYVHDGKPITRVDYMLAPADVWARAYVKAIGKWREQ
jgi:hypothetical protein